jgi:hypothetical protein
MTVSSPDHGRGQKPIVLPRENKDCALLHSSGPVPQLLSLTGMVTPTTEKWTSLMGNFDLHPRAGLFDTRDAMREHLPGFRKGVTSMGDTATDSSIYVYRRPVAQPIAYKERGVMRVLMAVDDSAFSASVLRAVETGVRHENTEVLVLHVLQSVEPVPPPEMARDYAPELEDEKQPTVPWSSGWQANCP